MKLPKIIYPGVYHHPEHGHGVCPHKRLNLTISGLVKCTNYDSNGKLLSTFDGMYGPAKPSLSVSFPGFHSDYIYGDHRENWVISFIWDALNYDPEKSCLTLDYEGVLLEMPLHLELTHGKVEMLRTQCRTIREYHLSAIPANQLAASIILQSLFLQFLQAPRGEDDAVEQLKKRLDQDENWEISILDHCKAIGVGRDTLRNKFMERYRIAPGEYRIRKRLQKIQDLFARTDLSLKEIAFAVGMKNATHLNSLLLQYYGKTPSELRKEFRQGTSGDPKLTADAWKAFDFQEDPFEGCR